MKPQKEYNTIGEIIPSLSKIFKFKCKFKIIELQYDYCALSEQLKNALALVVNVNRWKNQETPCLL